MNVYRAKNRLWMGNCLLGALALALVGLGLILPLDIPKALPSTQPATASAPVARGEPRADYYSVIWQRDLCGPLFDTVAGAAKPRFAARLVGTAIEPGYERGIFLTSKNETVFVGVGEKLEGAEIVSLAEGTATVTFNGEKLILTAQTQESKSP